MTPTLRLLRPVLLLMGLAAIATQVVAQPAPLDPKAEIQAAGAEAEKAAVRGPAAVPLRNQATLDLPAGFLFVPQQQADRYLRALGNSTGPTLLGLIASTSQDAQWMAVVRYIEAGYIKDDDAKTWNADELLKNLREGTDQQNEERRARGLLEMEIVGWVQPPTYDATTHRLVWSASSRTRGAAAGDDQGVNYNTYMLGREGYLTLNLVTGLALIERYKPNAHQLLASLGFGEGKRYADFNSSTDKVAEYGLAALVGGVAAKKLGLLAVIGVALVKFWKLVVLAVAGGGAVLMRKKKPKEDPTPPTAA